MKITKQEYVNFLWEEFNRKIQEEWDSNYKKEFGDVFNYDSFNNQMKFAETIRNRIVKHLGKNSREIVTSHRWHEYFKQNRLTKNTQSKTLTTISRYLDYENWKDFKEQNYEKIIEKKKIIVQKNSKPNKNEEIQSEFSRFTLTNKLLLIVILLLIALLISYFIQCKNQPKINNEPLVQSIIRSGNKLEFDIYSALPDTSMLSQLNNYFTLNGKAKKDILFTVNSSLEKGRELDTKHSNFNIIKFEDFKEGSENVEITATETWKLIWEDIKADSIAHRYNRYNKQDYFLKWENGKLKIDLYVERERYSSE